MKIHREGHTLLFVLLIVLTVINGLVNYFFPGEDTLSKVVLLVSILFYLIILQFFRVPYVNTPQDPNLVYAPADGKVVVIEETEETEYFQGKRKQVSIFMSPINVHVNKSPVTGQVKYFKYHPGKYLVAWHPKSSTENERTTMVIETAQKTELLLRQVAGALAKRIKWYVKEGDLLPQGGEFGFIKFGSRVDIYLPLDAEITVDLQQKTKGGRTVIAKLNQ
ncbi:phosphatidylserine decarboxylase family protein [Penaeicola halotolerans]|uniref:phosphatidylserine decarboxylase family protein n=1 Tax=Penaeicola halotolerans TaxID=2793196 RepID=UPI001CF8B785|nr:phosphatidylserine decarboxylase family protein [Penaeicola halotolerans]